jgi:hypothetical protein
MGEPRREVPLVTSLEQDDIPPCLLLFLDVCERCLVLHELPTNYTNRCVPTPTGRKRGMIIIIII